MNLDLENKVAIVTGASADMGKAVALSLAKERMGSSLLMTHIRTNKLKHRQIVKGRLDPIFIRYE